VPEGQQKTFVAPFGAATHDGSGEPNGQSCSTGVLVRPAQSGAPAGTLESGRHALWPADGGGAAALLQADAHVFCSQLMSARAEVWPAGYVLAHWSPQAESPAAQPFPHWMRLAGR
jgi:hypothetical protein